MPVSIITEVLATAGIKILRILTERAHALSEETEARDLFIIEQNARAATDEATLRRIFDSAQIRFTDAKVSNRDFLLNLADLFQYGGQSVGSFAEIIWKLYLFRLLDVEHQLWIGYHELYRRATPLTSRDLPPSWADWFVPMMDYLAIVDADLQFTMDAFDMLFTDPAIPPLLRDDDPWEIDLSSPADTYQQGPGIRAATTLNIYLNACQEQVGHIDPRGYPRSVNRSVPLEDIYVPLRIVSMRSAQCLHGRGRYREATFKGCQHATFHPLNGAAWLHKERGVILQDALDTSDLLVVLGGSGTGKTTLLRKYATEQAALLTNPDREGIQVETRSGGEVQITLRWPLPVYIDLAAFVDDHRPGERLTQYVQRMAVALSGDENMADLLAQLVASGQCVMLLDGLDQVATDEQRRRLVSAVADAAEVWRAGRNQVVVTSRFAGYDVAPLSPDFSVHIMRPLDRSEIGPYLLRWSQLLARTRRPSLNDAEVTQQAAGETIALVREITSSQSLFEMINSPLMLRLLVAVYRQGMPVSPRRVAIFNLITEALVHDWRLAHAASDESAMTAHEAWMLLEEIGFWMQASRPGGMVDEGTLTNILLRAWREFHPHEPVEKAEEAIETFVHNIRLNNGPFVELAPGQYGFIFHAIQEYFAARYLVSDFWQAPKRIRALLHDPRWDEVIRLAVGYVALDSRHNASELIETAILTRGELPEFAPSLHEDLLYRDLFVAARLLGSDVQARPDVTHDVTDVLMRLWVEGDAQSAGRFTMLFDSARRHLSQLDGTPAAWQAIQIARSHLGSYDPHRRANAIESLTLWPAYEEEALSVVNAAMAQAPKITDLPEIVRRAIAETLCQLRAIDNDTFISLMRLARGSDPETRDAARDALKRSGPVPEHLLAPWSEYVRSEDRPRRRIGARELGMIGALPPSIISDLLNMLDDDDRGGQLLAAEALHNVPKLSDDMMLALCRVARNDGYDAEVRAAAIDALARPVELPDDVFNMLMGWSTSDSAMMSVAAIRALDVCLNDSEQVIEVLVERLGMGADNVRAAVPCPLLRKAGNQQRVLHMLAHKVDDTSEAVRQALAEAFATLDTPDEEIVRALVLLLNDGSVQVRESALDAVAQIANPGRAVIDEVIDMIDIQQYGLGERAVMTLAQLRNLPDRAIRRLIQALPTHWSTCGPEIACCMWAHRPLEAEVISGVMDLAMNQPARIGATPQIPSGLRVLAIEILGGIVNESQTAVKILAQTTMERTSPEIQIAAVKALSHLRSAMWLGIKDTLESLLYEGPLEVRAATGIAIGRLVRYLPDPPYSAEEIAELANVVARLLDEVPPRASWEADTQTENELLLALNWLVARVRPTLPMLGS